jgi:tripartite-type tricarboxylate transporter receptor subunit TctC
MDLAGTTIALGGVSRIAWAQSYPIRPVRWIVGSSPGGVTDIVARVVGQRLSERLGQPFVIENRAGAAGNIGAEAAVRAGADGYTLLQINAANAINATLYQNLKFNIVRDIVPIAGVVRVPGVLALHPSITVNDVSGLIGYAKSNPGRLNMGTGGVGSVQHAYGELFKMLAGVDLLHVPYRGGAPALTALLAGQVHVMFSPIAEVIESVKSGKVRALAVTTAMRLDLLPDTPAVAEQLPGYEASGWQGVGAPKSTPAEVIEILSRAIKAATDDPTIRSRLADLGGVPLSLGPRDFGRLLADEIDKWGRVVKFAGMKAE